MNIFVVNNNQDDQRLCATIPAWSIFNQEAPHSGIIATYSDAGLLRNRIQQANLGEAKIAELNQAIDAAYQRPNTVHSVADLVLNSEQFDQLGFTVRPDNWG
jgi:hypothetical protein